MITRPEVVERGGGPEAFHRPPRCHGGLLDTRYTALASNTIDYWMLPDDESLTEARVLRAIADAPVLEDASLQIYIHVPFCAQRCRFCAFSGGNSLNYRQAERYAKLVALQLRDLLERTRIKGHPIRSVNIGGGSPDLLQEHVGLVLQAMRDLPGCTERTELSVELTLSTTQRGFIEQLVEHGVTKASFGVQSLDASVRGFMRQPRSLAALDRVLGWMAGRIPVVNADLITGLPGQDLRGVIGDLQTLMADGRINAISSYLLTPGAAPSLVAGLRSGDLPQQPDQREQALMRLNTYSTFVRAGWVRRGTNTYFNPARIDADVLERIAGNECIGASHYEAFLLAAGPQAVSYLPGARVENLVDVEAWCRALEAGNHPFHLPKCSSVPQRDTALWAFPLRWEGLPVSRLERMLSSGALLEEQIRTIEALEREGLVVRTPRGLELSLLGEVFMGQLVRDLKNQRGRAAVDAYIAEGLALGEAISRGRAPDANMTNNRQIALPILEGARRRLFQKLRQLPRHLYILYAGTTITRLGTFVFPYLTIYLSESRGYGVETVGMVLSVGSLGLLAGNLAGGWLADRWSRKWTLVAALVLNAAGFAALAGTYSSGWVYAALLLVGYAGSGMFTPAANTVIADLAPAAVRPFAYTVNYVCVNLGMALGPLAAGFLAAISYSWIFVGDVVSSLVCAALIVFALPETRRAGQEARRLTQTSRGQDGRATRSEGSARARIQTRRQDAERLTKTSIWLRHPIVLTFCLAYFFMIAPLMGLEYTVPLLVKTVLQEPLSFVGAVYTVNAVCILALSFFVERMVRGRDEIMMMVVAGVFWAAGLTILLVGFSAAALLVCTAVWTIGEIIGSILVPSFIAGRVAREVKGRFMALNDLVRSFAGVIGPIGLGFIWKHHGAGAVVSTLLVLPLAGIACYLTIFLVTATSRRAVAVLPIEAEP